jgi:hypothetical protein
MDKMPLVVDENDFTAVVTQWATPDARIGRWP